MTVATSFVTYCKSTFAPHSRNISGLQELVYASHGDRCSTTDGPRALTPIASAYESGLTPMSCSNSLIVVPKWGLSLCNASWTIFNVTFACSVTTLAISSSGLRAITVEVDGGLGKPKRHFFPLRQ